MSPKPILAAIIATFLLSSLSLSAQVGSFRFKDHGNMSLQTIEQKLDELAKGLPLTRVAAQWIIAKKLGWRVNVQKLVNINFQSAIEITASFPLVDLETRVFPHALADNRNAQAFHNVVRSLTHLVTQHAPLRSHSEYFPTNYNGHSEGQVGLGYQQLTSQRWSVFFDALSTDPNESWFWPELYRFYTTFEPAYTSCLEYMESKILRAQLIFLSRPELAELVFENRPKQFGKYNFTGAWDSIEIQNIDRLAERSDFVGQAIYFSSLDPTSLDWDFYIGMNGVIRDTSESAINNYNANFRSLGGDPSNSTYNKMFDYSLSVEFLDGVSLVIAKYWKYRSELEISLTEKGLAQKMAFEKYLNTPFLTETYFELVGLSSMSLAEWVEKLYRANPRTPYQVFGYNYSTSEFLKSIIAATKSLPSIKDTLEVKEKDTDYYPEDQTINYTFTELWHAIKDLVQ